MRLLVEENIINLNKGFGAAKSSQVIRLIDLANVNPLFDNNGEFTRNLFHDYVGSLSITELGIYVSNCVNLPKVGTHYTQPNDIIYVKHENIIVIFVESKREQDDALIIYLFWLLHKLCDVTVVTKDNYLKDKNKHSSIFSSCVNQMPQIKKTYFFSYESFAQKFSDAWLRKFPSHQDPNAMRVDRNVQQYYDCCNSKESYDKIRNKSYTYIPEMEDDNRMEIDE
jgi:hypothetical protein